MLPNPNDFQVEAKPKLQFQYLELLQVGLQVLRLHGGTVGLVDVAHKLHAVALHVLPKRELVFPRERLRDLKHLQQQVVSVAIHRQFEYNAIFS